MSAVDRLGAQEGFTVNLQRQVSLTVSPPRYRQFTA
jgi:hypothetical protein